MIRLARASFFSVFFVFTIVSGAELVHAQPAPGLTSMRVTHVASPKYKNGTEYEPIPANYLATPSDHGGSWLIVVVEETGYANGQYASFAGVSMKLANSEALYGADRRVYGYRRYYTYEKSFTSGRFNSSASSIAFPWGTKTASLNIR